jgi:O-acetylhomoserine (thiol)-lyase
MNNTTQEIFEKRIAALEGGSAALATASGAAAITYVVQNLAENGDHIVSSNAIYGGTFNCFAQTFRKWGITTTFVDPDDYAGFESSIKENTKLLFVETIGNPNAQVSDIERMADIAHRHGIPLVVDNTFATPYLFRPLEHGADIVVESATKFIGGHGTMIGGVIIESGKFDWKASGKFPQMVDPDPSYHDLEFFKTFGPTALCTRIRCILLRDTGACLSPVHAFGFLQGLETLSLRVERHTENALEVVRFLAGHPCVEKVNHPSLADHPNHALYEKYYPKGAGSIFTFEIKGGLKEAKKFSESLKIFSLLANVADLKSLVIHPASTTHSQLTPEDLAATGIKPNTLRISIGTEHIDDILADLDQALLKSQQ